MIEHMVFSDKPQQDSGVKPAFSISVIVDIVNFLRQKEGFAFFEDLCVMKIDPPLE